MNEIGVITWNVADMFREPNSSSERVSQAIFGETVAILDRMDDYRQIETPDGYCGWTTMHALRPLGSDETYPNPTLAAMVSDLFLPVFFAPSHRAERVSLLTLGSVVEFATNETTADYYAVKMPSLQFGFVYAHSLIIPVYPSHEEFGHQVAVVAKGMIGVPYLWGGRTTFGLDCSGFVQKVYYLCGVILPRDAWQQEMWDGFEPADIRNPGLGDTLYFAPEKTSSKERISHTGISLGGSRFIHSCGKGGVMISDLDEDSYADRLISVRRLKKRGVNG